MAIFGITLPFVSALFLVLGGLSLLLALFGPRIKSRIRTQLAQMRRHPLDRGKIIYRVIRQRTDLGTMEAQELGEHIANVELGQFSARYLRLQAHLDRLPRLMTEAKRLGALSLGIGGLIPLLTSLLGNIS